MAFKKILKCINDRKIEKAKEQMSVGLACAKACSRKLKRQINMNVQRAQELHSKKNAAAEALTRNALANLVRFEMTLDHFVFMCEFLLSSLDTLTCGQELLNGIQSTCKCIGSVTKSMRLSTGKLDLSIDSLNTAMDAMNSVFEQFSDSLENLGGDALGEDEIDVRVQERLDDLLKPADSNHAAELEDILKGGIAE